MKNRILYMFLLGLFAVTSPAIAQDQSWRANVPQPTAARDIKIGDYTSFNLKNGLKVIVVENHKLPRVSYQLSLQHNPISEGDQVGYISLAGNLLKNGTSNRTKAQIDEEVDFIGADLSTFGRGIYGSSLKKHSKKLLELFTDVLYNPIFPQEEFDKSIKQLKSGLASSKTSPEAMVGNTSSVLNYGANHPYGEIQQERHLDAMSIGTLKNYHKTYFKPNNAYLVIVGDITPKEAKKVAKKYFGKCKWKKGDIQNESFDYVDAPSKNRVALINKDGAVQSLIRITYPIDLKPGTPDVLKATVMNSALGGGGFSGRLMQNLREDKGYTYGARSAISSDKVRGSFRAFASVRNEVTDSSVVEFMNELNRMSTEPVTEDDLVKIKNSLAGRFARSLESPQTIARFAINTFKYDLPKDYYNTYLQRLDAISVADVQEMVKKYIKPENANIVIAGATDQIADKLVQFDGDGVIEYFDTFGNKIAAPSNDAGGATVENVINDYVKALGGKDKLKAVKSLYTKSSLEMMGREVTTTLYQTNDKMSMAVAMGPQVVQSVVFDGTKASIGGMGGSQVVTDTDKLKDFKSQAVIFPELDFKSDDYELKGMDKVDGEEAYKVNVKIGDKTKVNFYSKDSGLLLKSIIALPQGQQTTKYKDYKSVNGIMIPHRVVSEGMTPTSIEAKVTEVKVNGTVPAGTFTIK